MFLCRSLPDVIYCFASTPDSLTELCGAGNRQRRGHCARQWEMRQWLCAACGEYHAAATKHRQSVTDDLLREMRSHFQAPQAAGVHVTCLRTARQQLRAAAQQRPPTRANPAPAPVKSRVRVAATQVLATDAHAFVGAGGRRRPDSHGFAPPAATAPPSLAAAVGPLQEQQQTDQEQQEGQQEEQRRQQEQRPPGAAALPGTAAIGWCVAGGPALAHNSSGNQQCDAGAPSSSGGRGGGSGASSAQQGGSGGGSSKPPRPLKIEQLLRATELLQAIYEQLSPSEQREWTAKPSTLRNILLGDWDKQHSASALALLGHPPLRALLALLDQHDAAVVLNAADAAQAAWSVPGLTSAVRSEQCALWSMVPLRELGSRLYQARALPQTLPGGWCSTDSALSFVINERECCRQPLYWSDVPLELPPQPPLLPPLLIATAALVASWRAAADISPGLLINLSCSLAPVAAGTAASGGAAAALRAGAHQRPL